RSLVLLFMGGGMGAGKSTALKDILKEYVMKVGASANAIVMEADARKESYVIYRALSSKGHHDMLLAAKLKKREVERKLKNNYVPELFFREDERKGKQIM
ncbi:putative zeta toxin domain, P-loop containing nucleoside triphosphate hydrolase, partial [Tanacetum coccineum]